MRHHLGTDNRSTTPICPKSNVLFFRRFSFTVSPIFFSSCSMRIAQLWHRTRHSLSQPIPLHLSSHIADECRHVVLEFFASQHYRNYVFQTASSKTVRKMLTYLTAAFRWSSPSRTFEIVCRRHLSKLKVHVGGSVYLWLLADASSLLLIFLD